MNDVLPPPHVVCYVVHFDCMQNFMSHNQTMSCVGFIFWCMSEEEIVWTRLHVTIQTVFICVGFVSLCYMKVANLNFKRLFFFFLTNQTPRQFYIILHRTVFKVKHGLSACRVHRRGSSWVGRALDRHVADTGSIFKVWQRILLPESTFCTDSYDFHTPLHVLTCIIVCARVKDSAVHVRVWWIMETLKHPACTAGWVAWLCWSWLSLGKATWSSHRRNPMRTIQL